MRAKYSAMDAILVCRGDWSCVSSSEWGTVCPNWGKDRYTYKSAGVVVVGVCELQQSFRLLYHLLRQKQNFGLSVLLDLNRSK